MKILIGKSKKTKEEYLEVRYKQPLSDGLKRLLYGLEYDYLTFDIEYGSDSPAALEYKERILNLILQIHKRLSDTGQRG